MKRDGVVDAGFVVDVQVDRGVQGAVGDHGVVDGFLDDGFDGFGDEVFVQLE